DGQLDLDEKGRLRFTATGQAAPTGLATLDQVRLAPADVSPPRAATVHCIELAGTQTLTGQLLALDERSLPLRTAWAEEVAVPRHAVRSVLHPRGHAVFLDEDFESGLQAWRLTGSPALTEDCHTSGKHALLLSAAGQAAEYHLAAPLEAGRVGINF